MPNIVRYGRSEDWNKNNMDWVRAMNEDLGWNASLVTATNDNLATTIPYPQEWDPEDEVMTIYKMINEFWVNPRPQEDAWTGFLSLYSMVDRAPTATFLGVASDGDDEYLKSIFTQLMYSGRSFSHAADATGTEHFGAPADALHWSEYVPSLPIPAIFPVYYEIIGGTGTLAEGNGATAAASTGAFENAALYYDYTIRKMSRTEKRMMQGMPGMQQRWAALGS